MEGARPARDSLRIAILSTCALSTPPKAYGGTELVTSDLATALRRLGHEPTVFATGDSTCAGARRAHFDAPVWPPDDLSELRHASAAWHEIGASGEFDVVHVNHAAALPFARFVSIPTVATVHHERVAQLAAHYADHPLVAFAAISRRQAQLAWEVPFRAVIHHGLDVERYPYGAGGNACAFLGRFASAKAPHLAIEAARRSGLPIELGGEAHPPERTYFETRVATQLGPNVTWLGEVGHERKVDLLRRVRCLLFPIQWEEPFGLVMIESMLIGTPVIAFACGAAPEVVEEGVTGFLVHDLDEMVAKISDVGRLDRHACRAAARKRWSAERMARDYLDLYYDAIRHWTSTVVARAPELSRGSHAAVRA